MDVSGVSTTAAVMAVADQRTAAQMAEARVAVLARIQDQQVQTGNALVALIQPPASKPGVGENFSAWA